MTETSSGPLVIRLLETTFEVHCRDELAHEVLRILWEPFIVPAGPDAVALHLESDGASWRSWIEGGKVRESDEFWRALNLVRHDLIGAVNKRSSRFVNLHGAVLWKDGAALLLAGRTGSGKTTLALKLLEEGWSYMSDDVAPLDAGGLVHPFPKAPGVKDPARWPELGAAGFPPGVPVPTRLFFLPPAGLSIHHDPASIATVLFVTFDPEGEAALAPLSPAEVVGRASDQVFPLTPFAVSALAAACSGITGAEMTYGSSDQALEMVHESLNGLEDFR